MNDKVHSSVEFYLTTSQPSFLSLLDSFVHTAAINILAAGVTSEYLALMLFVCCHFVRDCVGRYDSRTLADALVLSLVKLYKLKKIVKIN